MWTEEGGLTRPAERTWPCHHTSPSRAPNLAHFTALQLYLSLSHLLAMVTPLDSRFVSWLVCGRSSWGAGSHPLCAAGVVTILWITAQHSWVMLQSPRAAFTGEGG